MRGIQKIGKVKRLGLRNKDISINDDEFVVPSISFKELPDIIEADKATLLKFLIGGKSRWGKNNLTIDLLNNNKELVFTTKNWSSQDYGFTILTKVTPKKAGKFTIDFRVNNNPTNSLTFDAKYILEEPEIVSDIKVQYTEEQKAKLIATVWGEAWGDDNLMINIPWIYYNLTKNLGFEKGLRRSSFYNNPKNRDDMRFRYRICMYYLGSGDSFKNESHPVETRGKKIMDYCVDTNSEFVSLYKNNLDTIRSILKKNIFDADTIKNPYYKWYGQGFFGDMDIRDNGEKIKWAKASQYFHLQQKGYVRNMYVKEIIAYNFWGHDITTYLCDDDKIQEYFKKNPSDLPQFKNNDYSSIPRVHIPKNRAK